MKKSILLLLLFAFGVSLGQNRIGFTYDNAGNQIKREICLCAARALNDSVYKTPETLTENDMLQDELYSQVSYYPNPVREELYVKWENEKNNRVTNILVYTITGQLMKDYAVVKENTTSTIPFRNYPEGFYNLILLYSNGEQKTLKIVKK